MKEEYTSTDFTPILQQFNLSIVRDFNRLKIAVLEVPQGTDLFYIIENLNQHTMVRYAEPNYIVHLMDTEPNDPYFVSKQWSLKIGEKNKQQMVHLVPILMTFELGIIQQVTRQ